MGWIWIDVAVCGGGDEHFDNSVSGGFQCKGVDSQFGAVHEDHSELLPKPRHGRLL